MSLFLLFSSSLSLSLSSIRSPRSLSFRLSRGKAIFPSIGIGRRKLATGCWRTRAPRVTLTFDRREIRVVLDLKISRNETSGASNYRVLENGALSSREIISETNDGYITVDVLNGDFANVTNSVYRQHKCNFIFAEIIKISSFHYTSNTRKHSKLELSKNLDQYIFTFETKIFVLNRKVWDCQSVNLYDGVAQLSTRKLVISLFHTRNGGKFDRMALSAHDEGPWHCFRLDALVRLSVSRGGEGGAGGRLVHAREC